MEGIQKVIFKASLNAIQCSVLLHFHINVQSESLSLSQPLERQL